MAKKNYIGGTVSQSRKTYLNKDKKLMQALSDLAYSYNIPPEVLIDRVAHEGVIDMAIRDYNNGIIGDDYSIMDNVSGVGGFQLLGLDDAFENYKSGKIKTNRPVYFERQSSTNEKGRPVLGGQFKDMYSALEVMAADIKSRLDRVQKDFPNLKGDDLNAAILAAYNMGETGYKRAVNSGTFRNYLPDTKGLTIPKSRTYTGEPNVTINMKDYLPESYRLTSPSFNGLWEFEGKSYNPNMIIEDAKNGIKQAADIEDKAVKTFFNKNWSEPYTDRVSYYNPYIDPNNKFNNGGLLEVLSRWNTTATDRFMNTPFGLGLNGLGIKSSGLGGIANAATSGINSFMNPNGNSTGLGNGLLTVGSITSNIPGIGGIIGAGVNLIGGLVNSAFGSKINEDFVNQTRQLIGLQANYVSGASTNNELLADFNSMNYLNLVNKKDVGSDGWFSHKASKLTRQLNQNIDNANLRSWLSIANTALGIDTLNDLNILANYSSYGGPLNIFGDGGGIHIKPSKRGTFTAAAKKHGKSVLAFASLVLANKDNYSPAMVKKANFARNAAKWHDDGGPLTDLQYLNIMERVAEDNYKKWGFNNPEEALIHSLNDNTYNYREYYNKYPNSRANADTHWPDEFKTVYHPTFSDESIYSGKKSQYNLQGLIGGHWDGEFFIPASWQRRNGKKAFGGLLGLDSFNNNVTMIGNGGTHELNPYEGVQMGVDLNGVPNLVEEGEVVYNDYVFSNRLKVPKEMAKKYRLRDNVTFALAAKKILKESSERPNDPISKAGLDKAMRDIMMSLESIRLRTNKNRFDIGGPFDKNNLLKLLAPSLYSNKPSTSLKITLGDRIRPIESRSIDSSTKESTFSPLRYAPIVGHAAGVIGDVFSKPDYSAADRINSVGLNPSLVGFTPSGTYLQYKPLDVNYGINLLNAASGANRRAIVDLSGGNRATAMAGLLASDYNYGNSLGSLYRQAEEYNQALREKAATFNRQTDLTNSELGLKAAMANAESINNMAKLRLSQANTVAGLRLAARDAYNTRRSNNINVLLDEIGGLGTEMTNKKWLDILAKNKVLRIDTNGNFIKANGGKLDKIKKGGRNG